MDPPTWAQGVSSSWTGAWPQPGRKSGTRAYFAVGQDEAWPLPSQLTIRYQEDSGTAPAATRDLGVGGYYPLWTSLMLKAGAGFRIVGNDPLHSYQHRVVDAATGQLVATLAAPVLGLGTLTPDAVHPAGDMNGDGYEEFFLTYFGPGLVGGPIDVVTLIDGASLSIQWSHSETGSYDAHTWHFGEVALPDLNLDSFADYVMVEQWVNPSTLAPEVKVVAISGIDGAELWRTSIPGVSSGPNRFLPDVDGDGVPDIALSRSASSAGSDVVAVLAGASGTIIWETPISVSYPYFVQGAFLGASVWNVVMPGPDPKDGVAEIVSIILGSYVNGSVEWAYLHWDAATGALRSIEGDPRFLDPWSPDSLSVASAIGTDHFPLGDIDRDGLEENAALATAVGWPTNGFQESRRLVILGQETLECPDQVVIGTAMQLAVGIPSAGGMECVLLASTGFDSGGGMVIDGWKTNLVASDPVLRLTLRTRAYSATLDSLGRGTFIVPVPAVAQLSGRTLYLRAVALRPGTTSEVWTLSSLGIVEML